MNDEMWMNHSVFMRWLKLCCEWPTSMSCYVICNWRIYIHTQRSVHEPLLTHYSQFWTLCYHLKLPAGSSMNVMLTGSLSVSHLSNFAVSGYITFPKMHGNIRKKERLQQIKDAPRKDKMIMFFTDVALISQPGIWSIFTIL